MFLQYHLNMICKDSSVGKTKVISAIILSTILLAISISIFATYYRYIVIQDFVIVNDIETNTDSL